MHKYGQFCTNWPVVPDGFDSLHSRSMFSGYITKTELAARMQVTTRTIDSWMYKGLVPFRKIGRTVRFDWEEVCEHLRARNQPPVKVQVRHAETGIAEMLRQRAAEIRRSTR